MYDLICTTHFLWLQVYVGNLVAGLVTEDALRQLFNSTMKAAFPNHVVPGLDPVVSVSMHSEGRYAFVELRSPEMASAALQLSNQACSIPFFALMTLVLIYCHWSTMFVTQHPGHIQLSRDIKSLRCIRKYCCLGEEQWLALSLQMFLTRMV